VVKNFGEKAALQGLAKKTLANVDLHPKINSKTRPDHFLAHAGRYMACNISTRKK